MPILECQVGEGAYSGPTITGEDSRSAGSITRLRALTQQLLVLRAPFTIHPGDGSPAITVPAQQINTTPINARAAHYVLALDVDNLRLDLIRQQDLAAQASSGRLYVTHYITPTHVRRYQPRPITATSGTFSGVDTLHATDVGRLLAPRTFVIALDKTQSIGERID